MGKGPAPPEASSAKTTKLVGTFSFGPPLCLGDPYIGKNKLPKPSRVLVSAAACNGSGSCAAACRAACSAACLPGLPRVRFPPARPPPTYALCSLRCIDPKRQGEGGREGGRKGGISSPPPGPGLMPRAMTIAGQAIVGVFAPARAIARRTRHPCAARLPMVRVQGQVHHGRAVPGNLFRKKEGLRHW